MIMITELTTAVTSNVLPSTSTITLLMTIAADLFWRRYAQEELCQADGRDFNHFSRSKEVNLNY